MIRDIQLTSPPSRVWNQNGDFVGMTADPGTVDHGNLGEVHVDHENQGVYSLFSANNNAICVAWVTTTWSEDRGGNHYAVQGDMGYYCGASWYYSGMYYNSDEDVGSLPAEDQPKCFWIDENGDQPHTGFQVRWPAFSTGEVNPDAPAEERDPKQKCDGISFGMRDEQDPSSVNFWTRRKRNNLSGVSGFPKRRQVHQVRRSEGMASKLVLGDVDGLSAKFLCESDTSVGPDLANTKEGLFCDMGEKKVYDLCSESVQAGCFDVDSKTFKPASNATIARRQIEKTYETTIDWRKNTDGGN